MSKRIYIGNLPWSVTKDKLEELFSSFGDMEDALVVANKYTGRSRGFGFVTFKNDADADKAIAEMNEKEVEGRALVVKEARPRRNEGSASASDDSGNNSEKKEQTDNSEKKEEKSESKSEEKSEDESKEEKTVLEKEAEKDSEGSSEEEGSEKEEDKE